MRTAIIDSERAIESFRTDFLELAFTSIDISLSGAAELTKRLLELWPRSPSTLSELLKRPNSEDENPGTHVVLHEHKIGAVDLKTHLIDR